MAAIFINTHDNKITIEDIKNKLSSFGADYSVEERKNFKQDTEIIFRLVHNKIVNDYGPIVSFCHKTNTIGIYLRYADNKQNILRKFLSYLLLNYNCTGQDDDGFYYRNSSECNKWMKLWLPT